MKILNERENVFAEQLLATHTQPTGRCMNSNTWLKKKSIKAHQLLEAGGSTEHKAQPKWREAPTRTHSLTLSWNFISESKISLLSICSSSQYLPLFLLSSLFPLRTKRREHKK